MIPASHAFRIGWAASFVFAVLVTGTVSAQESGSAAKSGSAAESGAGQLGLDSGSAGGLRLPKAEARANDYGGFRAADNDRGGAFEPYRYYWGTPWYVYQSTRLKQYPPPYSTEPRLGLHNVYGFHSHVGLQLPGDSSPIVTPRLPPFRGVVRSPQTPEWLHKKAGSRTVLDQWGLRLIHAGDYKAAGRLQAKGFRLGEDPRYPLYLAESLFALGKFRHAEMVLRHVLEQDVAYDFLPEDVAGHFPSAADFERKLGALEDSDEAPLLKAYLLLFSRDGSKGLDALQAMMAADPKDEAPARLYRHFLGKAFGPDEPEADAKPAEAPKSENESRFRLSVPGRNGPTDRSSLVMLSGNRRGTMIARLIPYLLMFGAGFMVATLFIRRYGPTQPTRRGDGCRRTLEIVRGLLREPRSSEDAVRKIDGALKEIDRALHDEPR